jgi:hypothetical protein
MPEEKTGRTEMVGKVGKAGRIVVLDEDVPAYIRRGYVIVEPTKLHTSPGYVPDKELAAAEAKPEAEAKAKAEPLTPPKVEKPKKGAKP